MWLGTFHGICYRILRTNYREASLPKNFQIIENDLTIDGKFREDIWKRLKRNQSIFMDGWDKYFWKKYNEL